MKWRPEILIHKRKVELNLSQENFVKHVYKFTRGKWKLSVARLQKLESHKNYNICKMSADEFGMLFNILKAKPNDFWK